MGATGSVFERPGSLDVTQRLDQLKLRSISCDDERMTDVGNSGKWEDPSQGETENESNKSTSSKVGDNQSDFSSAINRSVQDLKIKSHYVLANPVIAQIFIRYMFHGMWIIDLLQVPKELYISPSLSRAPSSFLSNNHLAEETDNYSMVSLIQDLEKADLFDTVNKEAWLLFLQHAHQHIETLSKDPLGISFAPSSISFMEQILPEDKNNITILTIAIAMQIFCRSELFLQLSEKCWCRESVRSVQWQDYARIGRSQVARHYSQQDNNQEQICGISTVAFLDALYVRLLTNSSQVSVHKFLHCRDWIHELEVCLNALPVDFSIYETASKDCNGEPVWHCLARNNFRQGICNDFPSKSSFSADHLHQFMYKLCTTPSPSFFVSLPAFTHGRDTDECRYKFQFSAVTPVFRCPLLTFAETENCFEQQKSYKWDTHQIVVSNIMIPASPTPVWRKFSLENGILAHDSIHELTLRNIQAAIDISFLIAQIMG